MKCRDGAVSPYPGLKYICIFLTQISRGKCKIKLNNYHNIKHAPHGRSR